MFWMKQRYLCHMTLKEKYPKEFFGHWIGMLSATNCPLTLKGYEDQIDMYLEFEGDEAFLNLQTEIKEIIKNNDVEGFVEVAEYFEMEDFTEESLLSMMDLIINVDLEEEG